MATTKIKFKKIDLNFVKKNYPVLDATLSDIFLKEYELSDGVDKALKQAIAGLCIEIALKSDGTVDLFEEDIPKDLLKEDYEDDNY